MVQRYLDRKVVSSKYTAAIGTRPANDRLLPPAASSNARPASTSALSEPNAPIPNDDEVDKKPDFFTDCLRNENADLRTRVAHSLLGALHPPKRPAALTRVARTADADDSTPISGERATQQVAMALRSSMRSSTVDASPSSEASSIADLRDKYAAFVPPPESRLPDANQSVCRGDTPSAAAITTNPSGPESVPESVPSQHLRHTQPPRIEAQSVADEFVLERDAILKVPKYKQTTSRSRSLHATRRSVRRSAALLGADSWFAGMGFRPSEK